MARERYPSDDARLKQKPHVKVHLRARTHRKTASAFVDPETRGIITGLWMLAGEAFAAKTNDTVILTHGDVAWLTGREQVRAGLASLRRACDAVSYTMRAEGRTVSVHVRNFAQKQGFDSARRGVVSGDSADSASLRDPSTKEPITEGREDSAPPSAPLPTDPPKRVRKPRAPADPEAVRCAQLLSDLLEAKGVSVLKKPGYIEKWGRDVERLRHQASDIREAPEPWKLIEFGIRWLMGPENCGDYPYVVHSAGALLEKWPKFQARLHKQHEAKKAKGGGLDAWVNSPRSATH